MRRATQIGLTVLVILSVVAVAPLAYCEEPSKPPSPAATNKAPEMSEAKQKAIARASAVPTQLKFDLTKYISVPLDKNEPSGVLNDSAIKPYVVPVALDADWWIVLFLPESPEMGPPICVYLDKQLDVIRGYIIGLPLKGKTSISDAEKAKVIE